MSLTDITVFGPPLIYLAPNTGTAVAAPGSSVAKGTAWGGTYVSVGETMGDVEFSHAAENHLIRTNRFRAAVNSIRQQETPKLKFTAHELTRANMKYALGQGTLSTGSTEYTMTVGANTVHLPKFTIGVEGYGPGTTDQTVKYRRYVFHRCSITGDMLNALKTGEETPLEMEFDVLVDANQDAGEELYTVIDLI